MASALTINCGTVQAEVRDIPTPTQERMWERIRALRNNRLKRCDWTQLTDSPLSSTDKAAWVVYRQALRDITKQPDPTTIVWPEEPA